MMVKQQEEKHEGKQKGKQEEGLATIASDLVRADKIELAFPFLHKPKLTAALASG